MSAAPEQVNEVSSHICYSYVQTDTGRIRVNLNSPAEPEMGNGLSSIHINIYMLTCKNIKEGWSWLSAALLALSKSDGGA